MHRVSFGGNAANLGHRVMWTTPPTLCYIWVNALHSLYRPWVRRPRLGPLWHMPPLLTEQEHQNYIGSLQSVLLRAAQNACASLDPSRGCSMGTPGKYGCSPPVFTCRAE
eukprot:365084-Chlamydomonas_euryale.AAC.26